jgi:hypothetical protein
MTLSPDDLAAMERGHRESPPTVALRYCTRCGPGFPWPCDSRRLLDEVEALRVVFSSPGFVLDHAGKREAGWPIEEVEQALGIKFDVNIGGES